jgi:hypothetical protein
MNPRLGILGGLSILGTSGIVRPFSCAAYIASIHQGIDVAHTNGYTHIAACTGNASEDTMRRVYGLPEIALIEMGDFVGAVLKHLRKVPVPRLSLCGGFGKISKLAAGHMDLHSRHSSIDLPQLAGWAADIGADAALQAAIAAPTPASRPSPWPCRRHRPGRRGLRHAPWPSPAAWCRRRCRWKCSPSTARAASSAGRVCKPRASCCWAASPRPWPSPAPRPAACLQPGRYRPRAAGPACQVRVGGYGGAEGLARYLREEGITLLIDATHPYAAQISRNAARLRAAPASLLGLRRPAWQAQAGTTGARSRTGPG